MERNQSNIRKNISIVGALFGIFVIIPISYDKSYYFTFPLGFFCALFIFSPLWSATLGRKFVINTWKKIGLCGILFFILSLISNQHYAKIEQQRQSREVAENERTLEELKKLSPLELAQIEFEPIIKEALRNNRDVKFPEIKVIWNKYGSSFKVEVDYVISGSLTSVVDSFTLISAARLIAKEMAERPSLAIIDELKLNGKIVGLNKYGNQSFAQGAIVTLQPSEIKKINWANMDHTNFRLFLEASDALWIKK